MADINFSDFLETINGKDKDFAANINTFLLRHDCKCEMKAAAKGYTVSYILPQTNKTLATFVCRKTGVKLRIYPRNLNSYGDFLNTLPDKMKKDIRKASPCKRLINPDDCNPKCVMGYDFLMDGEHYQKCRYMAFMPILSDENNPFIISFLEKELL
ncbi:MAG TPA: hypothetical protein GXX75_20120 [Clostridiales bacterium]|nr:hypothetical protein [Clostridiales bacterium]